MTDTPPDSQPDSTDTVSPPKETPTGVLLPKGVVQGITDIGNGDTATRDDIESVLKF